MKDAVKCEKVLLAPCKTEQITRKEKAIKSGFSQHIYSGKHISSQASPNLLTELLEVVVQESHMVSTVDAHNTTLNSFLLQPGTM